MPCLISKQIKKWNINGVINPMHIMAYTPELEVVVEGAFNNDFLSYSFDKRF